MSKNKEEQTQTNDSQNQLANYLKATKDEHYNFEEKRKEYKFSSGSLLIDSVLGGGFSCGLVRLCGASTGGKTSESFVLCDNFMKTVPNSKTIYFKCEGRLSEELKNRSKVKFVEDPKNWINGTCFIYCSNVYENILGIIQDLIFNNEEDVKYCFILDSIDAVILRGDKDRKLEEANKVAGPNVIAKKFFQQCGMALYGRGHSCVFTSQVTAAISLDPYKPAPNRMINGGGGNALIHWADYIIQFLDQNQGDLILENPKEKPSDKNRILGHWCKIEIKKSNNETKGQKISYPIRHGGYGIWREKEISDYMLMKTLLVRAGAWYSFEKSVYDELIKQNKDTPVKFQGLESFHTFLETNKSVTDYLYNLFLGMIEAEYTYNKSEVIEHEIN